MFGLLGDHEALSTVMPLLLYNVAQTFVHAYFPQIVINLVCERDFGNQVDCDGVLVSKRTSIIILWAALMVNVPSLLTIGFYGSFANKFGLKKTLVVPVIGNFLCITTIFAALYITSVHYLPLLLLGSFISGISGNRNTFVMASFTYAADTSNEEDRSQVFSVIESAIYFAKIFAPAVVGLLAQNCGFQVGLLIGLLFSLSTFAWIVLQLKDVNPTAVVTVTIGQDETYLQWNPLASFHGIMRLFGRNAIGNAALQYMTFAYFLYHLVIVGEHTIEIIFQKHVYRWDADTIGYYGSAYGIIQTVSMLLLPHFGEWVLRRHMHDIFWIELGLWLRVAFFFLFGLTNYGWQAFALISLLIFCGPIAPRTRSLMSKSVHMDHQTELFVGVTGLEAVAAFLAPLFSAGYSATVEYFPGCMYELFALSCFISAFLFIFTRYQFHRQIAGYGQIKNTSTSSTYTSSSQSHTAV